MSALDDLSNDEEFASRLAEYDEALAAGAPPKKDGLSAASDDSTLIDRLSRAQRCLRLLEQVWARCELMTAVELHAETQYEQSTQQTPDYGALEAGLNEPAAANRLKIGRFEILRELGRGGFGVVLLAFDPVLGREVALKVPRPETLLTTSLRERMIREAQAAAGLSHPNLVPVYEAGQVGPIFYVASAYCAGKTLAQWLAERKSPVSPRRAAELASSLADAMQHAHARGILHRDLTPSNVLLEPCQTSSSVDDELEDAETFIARLTDFGLARFIERRSAQDCNATPARTILGTPSYMAPEQLSGGLEVQGPASDVYGLGAILYELLGGRPPHLGKTDSETLVSLLREEPPELRRLRRNVPRDLEAICQRSLAKDPGKRYASAAEFADDLRRYLQNVPTRARPLGLASRACKWAHRQPATATLLAVCAAALLATPLAVYWHESRLHSAVGQVEQDRTATENQRRAVEDRVSDLSRRYRIAGIKLAQAAYDMTDVHEAVQFLEQHRSLEGGEESRGFFWHYLWRLCHGDPVTLRGHTDSVQFLMFSADGQVLGSAGQDGTIMLWDMPSGKRRTTLTGHVGRVHAICFSPDGSTLASCGDDRTVRLWDTRTGEQRSVLCDGGAEMFTLVFSPDGRMLAVAGAAKIIELWETSSWHKQGELKGHTGDIRNMGWTVDGRYLASGSDDQTVKVWDLESPLQPRYEFKHNVPVTCVTFSHDGQTLAASGREPTVKLWDMTTGKLRFDLEGNVAEINYVEFSRDNRWLATVARTGVLRIWDAKNGTQVRYVQGHADQVWCAAFSPLDNTLATASADRTVKLWDLANWNDELALPPPTARIESLAFTTHGKILACGDAEGVLHWYDVPSGELRQSVQRHSDRIVKLASSADGVHLASASQDGTVRVWNPSDGAVRWTLPDHSGGALSLSFSADSKILATGDGEGSVRLWDLSTGELQRTLHQYPEAIRALDFTKQGSRLAVGHGRMIGLWDLTDIGAHRELCGPEAAIEELVWSNRQGTLAAVDTAGRVYDWDNSLGTANAVLSRRTTDDRVLGFGSSGRMLITGNSKGIVKFWGFTTEQVVFSLDGHDGSVTTVVFSPDGRTLATAAVGRDGRNQLFVWSSAAGED